MIALSDELNRRMEQLLAWIRRKPEVTENRWLRRLREMMLVLLIFAREFSRDRIPLRASALTFTIILSLVPTLALGTAVLKGLGAGDQMRQAAHRFIDQMESAASIWGESEAGSSERHFSAPSTQDLPVDAAADNQAATYAPDQAPSLSRAPPADEEPASSSAHLRQAIDQIFDYVEATDFTTLGAFGIIGLVAAVIIVLGSIERSMNAIWQTSGGRPMGRRLMDYLALMIMLPLAVNLTLATEATLQSEALQARLRIFIPLEGLESFLVSLIPLLLLTVTFTLLYRFLPATRVKFTPALIGAFFGAVAWLLVQGLYLKLQIGVARYNAIYGSFATLPLFLVWLQLCWTIFLAGAEMSFATQARHNYRWDDEELSPANRLTLAFTLLLKAQENFQNRQLSDPARLATELQQPELVIHRVAGELVSHQLLRYYQDPENQVHGYLPSTPLNQVKPVEVMDIILGTDIPPLAGATLTQEALSAARQALSSKTFHDNGWQQPTSVPGVPAPPDAAGLPAAERTDAQEAAGASEAGMDARRE
ncbi:YihY/virulence factor BrkB family protein [Desulfurivibrio dismutans]|uniref:YihY/virulence factor BrkB family protein n=1 Tax=Desulfurivibrio dismutans TaxID=1398908 RepID=UPI0023DBD033|nr:YihY/virulence factor BrkB family protein [Desulfurivibrio alkaliphilus]MDF1615216.1 YihY/virulence factor BrkB family protein [Desulfurivibrio alkaliphilus]